MSYLKSCPRCQAPGQQRGGPNSFCSCSDVSCPISSIRIPVQAWQSWPRCAPVRPSMQLVTPQEHEQRNQEINRLQERLKEFGGVEADNLRLRRAAKAIEIQTANLLSRQELLEENQAAAERSCSSMRAERDKLLSCLEDTTRQRDVIHLALQNIAKRVQDGCRVSLEANDHQAANLYEELLGVLGKHDACTVPCLECGQLPSKRTVQAIGGSPRDVLECRCTGQYTRQWTPEQWLKRRSAAVLKRDRTPAQSQQLTNQSTAATSSRPAPRLVGRTASRSTRLCGSKLTRPSCFAAW